MVKSTGLSAGLATTIAVCGGWQASKVFVLTSASPSSSSSNANGLRGASSSQAASASNQDGPVLPVGMMATGALALLAATGRNHTLRTARKAAEAAEAPAPPPFDPAVQVGAMAPLGYFDPLGFSKVGDKEGFRKLRSAEIKHGRVAMMAAVGAVVQHFIQFPGFENVPKGLGALTSLPGQVGFAVLFAVSGALEILVWKDSDDKEPGDFGNPFSLEKDPQTGQSVPIGADPRNRELNNGRMAMFSILGIMVAELATGKDAIEQFGL